MPFIIVDHFIGLGSAGVSVFLMAPVFSSRLDEVLSWLASPGFFRLFGRKQNGIAARKLITPPIKKPSHHAPTQRESCGVIVMLPRNKRNRTKLFKWDKTSHFLSAKKATFLQRLNFSGNDNYLMRDLSPIEGIRNDTLNGVMFNLSVCILFWVPFCVTPDNLEVLIQHLGHWMARKHHLRGDSCLLREYDVGP